MMEQVSKCDFIPKFNLGDFLVELDTFMQFEEDLVASKEDGAFTSTAAKATLSVIHTDLSLISRFLNLFKDKLDTTVVCDDLLRTISGMQIKLMYCFF